MNKVYRWALRYQAAISMVLALFVFALFSMWQPARAVELPESLTFQQQMFGLICGTPEALKKELLDAHGEVPVVAGLLDGGTQWIMYVSEDKNTMSFVIHKSETEACLVWSGSSELGQAFMLNPNPDFPSKETSNKDWNT